MCVTVGPAGGKDGEDGGDRGEEGEEKEAEAEILEEHATLCRELLQVEENSKWALLTLLFLLSLQQEGLEARGGGGEELLESAVEMQSIAAQLVEIDAPRRGYYADVVSRAHLRAACAGAARASAASEERGGGSGSGDGFEGGAGGVARLCGLSLSSLTDVSLVRLLGLKVLDVSDNALMDLDGVEILYGLQKIVADRCRLRSLAALVALPSLTSLSVRENTFSSVPDLLQVPASVSVSLSLCLCLCLGLYACCDCLYVYLFALIRVLCLCPYLCLCLCLC